MRKPIVFFCILFSGTMLAQDVHFSQFHFSKSTTNPSLMHFQENDYEINLQRRSQWSSVSTPFKTLLISFNAKNLYKNISIGATLLNDEGGDAYFSTDGISLLLSRSIKVKKRIFAVGIQTSFYNRSLNYDELIFNEDEFLDFRNFSFIDFSFGFSAISQISKSSKLISGCSAYHLNNPRQSFYSIKQVYLSPKYILHSSYSKILSNNIELSPTIYFSNNEAERELIIGSGVTYKLNDKLNLKSGFYNRINDAVFFTLGIQNENIQAVISYDINTSSLSNASNSFGGLEFVISYGWNIKKNIINKSLLICPKYL